jgi:flavin-dependent dehydrogenase
MVKAVRIAGAGPAGLGAACLLAEAGTRVDVFDKGPRPGSKEADFAAGLRNYGEPGILEELGSYGLRVQPFSTAQTVVRRSPHFRNILRGPSYHVIARGAGPTTVERQLFDRAVRAGARVHFGVPKKPEDVDIVATGHPEGPPSLLGVGFTFSREGSPMDDTTLYGLLDNDIAPAGYFALAPGPESNTLYAVSWTDLDLESMRRRFAAALERPWVRELVGSARRLERVECGAYFARNPIAEAVDPSGALRVGEAAGFLDAIGGYGVRYALITGSLAAKSFLEDSDYASLLRRAFGNEFEESYAFRMQLNRASNEDMDKLVASMGPEMDLAAYRSHRASRLL